MRAICAISEEEHSSSTTKHGSARLAPLESKVGVIQPLGYTKWLESIPMHNIRHQGQILKKKEYKYLNDT